MLERLKRFYDPQPLTPAQLRDHIYSTYFHLRVGLCVIAFAFPILLLVIGWWHSIHPQGSMSAYYFAFSPEDSNLRVFPGRVLFVGILFALGVALYLYKGLTIFENVMLNFAGFFALVAALFPMQPPLYCKDQLGPNCGTPIPYVHEAAGFVVFGCLIAVAWHSADRSALDSRTKNLFPKLYKTIAALMFFLPATAVVMAAGFGIKNTWLFIVEGLILWTFAAYWGVRTWELHLSGVEKEAIKGVRN
jgi:hypothetical protein